MLLPVKLEEVAQTIGTLDDETHAYINRRTGELVTVTDEDLYLAENESDAEVPEWQREMVESAKVVLGSDDYIPLPGQFDFHEYRVMESFCLSLEETELQEKLLSDLRGRGAFRRFKDGIHEAAIDKLWYDYRDQALRDLAADFLEAEGIPVSGLD